MQRFDLSFKRKSENNLTNPEANNKKTRLTVIDPQPPFSQINTEQPSLDEYKILLKLFPYLPIPDRVDESKIGSEVLNLLGMVNESTNPTLRNKLGIRTINEKICIDMDVYQKAFATLDKAYINYTDIIKNLLFKLFDYLPNPNKLPEFTIDEITFKILTTQNRLIEKVRPVLGLHFADGSLQVNSSRYTETWKQLNISLANELMKQRYNLQQQEEKRRYELRQEEKRQYELRQEELRQYKLHQEELRRYKLRQEEMRLYELRQEVIKRNELLQEGKKQCELQQHEKQRYDFQQLSTLLMPGQLSEEPNSLSQSQFAFFTSQHEDKTVQAESFAQNTLYDDPSVFFSYANVEEVLQYGSIPHTAPPVSARDTEDAKIWDAMEKEFLNQYELTPLNDENILEGEKKQSYRS